MEYTDKTLVCKDCGAEFTFTAGEQAFLLKKVLKMSLQDAKHAELLKRMLSKKINLNN